MTHAKRQASKLYCDGACEPNPGKMGIGVFCEAPKIEISAAVGSGTNNKAECLAAIAALEEADLQNLSGFLLFSDSQLVCNWTTGSFQCRSAVAQKYVPEIRRRLDELGGKIRWCPGHLNPADALSRHCVGNRPHQASTTTLQRIIETPMDGLRFRDFLRLNVGGRDEFSRIRLPQLKEMVPDHGEVEATFEDDRSIASCLRWMLRGLPLDKALRKVSTDLEIAASVKQVRQH